MDNPFVYILIALFCSSIMLSVIFLMAWYTMGRQKYALIFSVSFMVSTVLWAINLSRSLFASQEFYWMLATSFSILAVAIGTWGHCLRTHINIPAKYFFSFGGLGVCLTFYFTVIDPHIGLRMSLYLFCDVVLLSTSAIVILAHRKKSRPAEIGTSIVHFIFAFSLFAAALIALSQGRQLDIELAKLYASVNFVTLPAAYVGTSAFVVYMLASDLAEELKILAMTDPLTSCLNRRGFYESAKEKLTDYKQQSLHVCLIYWDIDKFKSINDKFGHSGGDLALVSTATQVQQHIKSTDLMGRIGGEEFVILVARTSYQDAIDVAERLRQQIANHPIQYNDSEINVTASFGVVDINSADASIEAAIDLADGALYSAKESGRNKVVCISQNAIES